VSSAGTINAAAAKNITFLAKPSAGTYCLKDTAGTATVAEATPDISGADGRKTNLGVDVNPALGALGCPPGTNLIVVTATSNVLTDNSFFLAVIA
jgi:hypothetical protein